MSSHAVINSFERHSIMAEVVQQICSEWTFPKLRLTSKFAQVNASALAIELIICKSAILKTELSQYADV